MTQRVLATRIGVTESALRHWEDGRRTPNASNLIRLAKALAVSPETLEREIREAV